jgi:transposase
MPSSAKQRRPGRPRTGTTPERTAWQVAATLAVEDAAVTRAVQRTASFLVATNVLDTGQLTDQALIQTYKEQHSVERGFSFLKDPLFLASSVFVNKPSRIVALSLVMVLCLLVYRLAEHRLRTQLAATGQTVPNQLKQPTDRPTMRWMFQCFEGISLVGFTPRTGTSPAWSRCTSKWSPYWGCPVKNSTKSTNEAGDHGLRHCRYVLDQGGLFDRASARTTSVPAPDR